MSQARKKFSPKSTQPAKKGALSESETSETYIKKLDNLRINVKEEQKNIVVDNTAKNTKLAAAAIIVIVSMAGIIVLSQSNILPGIFPKSNQKNWSPTIDNFQKDNNAIISLSGNKITFVYVGGEFCPFCAMERWAIVMALEQFGTFTTPPSFITSAEDSIATYSFHPLSSFSYSSTKVDFQPVEIYDNNYNAQTQSYGSLDSPNSLQSAELNKYGSGSIPFICIGGIYFRSGAGGSLTTDSFSSLSSTDITNQINSKTGTVYNQIATESNFLVQLINQTIYSTTTTSATTTA